MPQQKWKRKFDPSNHLLVNKKKVNQLTFLFLPIFSYGLCSLHLTEAKAFNALEEFRTLASSDYQPYDIPDAQPTTFRQKMLVHQAQLRMALLQNQYQIGFEVLSWENYLATNEGKRFTVEGYLTHGEVEEEEEEATEEDKILAIEDDNKAEEEADLAEDLKEPQEVAAHTACLIINLGVKRSTQGTKQKTKKIFIKAPRNHELKLNFRSLESEAAVKIRVIDEEIEDCQFEEEEEEDL